jgi:hypothetical protein
VITVRKEKKSIVVTFIPCTGHAEMLILGFLSGIGYKNGNNLAHPGPFSAVDPLIK